MIKSNSSIYLFPKHAVFNPEKVPSFESFSRDNSVLLYSSLYSNFREVFEPYLNKINIVYIFDDSDKEYIPLDFRNDTVEIFTGDIDKKISLLNSLGEKYFGKFANNLVIFSDAIGICPSDIDKMLNILSIEDDVFLIEKTPKDEITSIGINSFNKLLFEEIDWYNFNYNSMLRLITSHDHLLHVLTGHMAIKDLEDFRNLYKELSKKESMAYCSHNMHEKFTHLFIEYKDMLK